MARRTGFYPISDKAYNPAYQPTTFDYFVGDLNLPSVGGVAYYDSDGRLAWLPREENQSAVPYSLLPYSQASVAYSPEVRARLQAVYGGMPSDYGATNGVLYNTQGAPYRDASGYWLSPYAPAYFADSHPYLANSVVDSIRGHSGWGPYKGTSQFVDMVTQAIIPYMYPDVSQLPTVPDDYEYQLRYGSY